MESGKVITTSDRNVSGEARLGAKVEYKGSKGVVLKLKDVSVYTVVFDDMDEKTMKRSSLRIKGTFFYFWSIWLNSRNAAFRWISYSGLSSSERPWAFRRQSNEQRADVFHDSFKLFFGRRRKRSEPDRQRGPRRGLGIFRRIAQREERSANRQRGIFIPFYAIILTLLAGIATALVKTNTGTAFKNQLRIGASANDESDRSERFHGRAN